MPLRNERAYEMRIHSRFLNVVRNVVRRSPLDSRANLSGGREKGKKNHETVTSVEPDGDFSPRGAIARWDIFTVVLNDWRRIINSSLREAISNSVGAVVPRDIGYRHRSVAQVIRFFRAWRYRRQSFVLGRRICLPLITQRREGGKDREDRAPSVSLNIRWNLILYLRPAMQHRELSRRVEEKGIERERERKRENVEERERANSAQ